MSQREPGGQTGAVESSGSMSEKEIEDQVEGLVGEYFSVLDKREVDARIAVRVAPSCSLCLSDLTGYLVGRPLDLVWLQRMSCVRPLRLRGGGAGTGRATGGFR
jgi:hypothetical protein